MNARTSALFLLAATYFTCVESRLRAAQDQEARRRSNVIETNYNTDLNALEHFGLNPSDFQRSSGSSFQPCDDVKVCEQMSVLVGIVDDCFLQNPQCIDVNDCAQGECRHTPQGFLCDRPNQELCMYPCVEDDLGQGSLP